MINEIGLELALLRERFIGVWGRLVITRLQWSAGQIRQNNRQTESIAPRTTHIRITDTGLRDKKS